MRIGPGVRIGKINSFYDMPVSQQVTVELSGISTTNSTNSGSLTIYHPNLAAVIAYANNKGWTIPSQVELGYINESLNEMTANGILALTDRLYIIITSEENFSYINYITPSDDTTISNSAGWNSTDGLVGDGVNSASCNLDLNALTNFSLNEAWFAWSGQEGPGGGYGFASLQSPSILTGLSNTAQRRFINSGTSAGDSIQRQWSGVGITRRIDSNTIDDKVGVGDPGGVNATSNSISIPTPDMSLLARPGGGESDAKLGVFAIGGGIPDQDAWIDAMTTLVNNLT